LAPFVTFEVKVAGVTKVALLAAPITEFPWPAAVFGENLRTARLTAARNKFAKLFKMIYLQHALSLCVGQSISAASILEGCWPFLFSG
jgi:hypothetical protein